MEQPVPIVGWFQSLLVNYICGNCFTKSKPFALAIAPHGYNEVTAAVKKIGEDPPFGPPLPTRFFSLIGPDRDLFLQGRRAENLGFGVGAFAYYRQVVENQKGRFISQIAQVAKRQGASDEVMRILEAAAKETQFQKAVADIKSVFPNALLIDGHNPMRLLHDALSKGLHGGTDEHCLQLATFIRKVLTELSERISTILKDQAELKQAISKLPNPPQVQVSLPSPEPEQGTQ